MNPHLRDRIVRKLEELSDERGYQVLDYVEFLESKYAERQNPPATAFSRFSDAVEDTLRSGRVSASRIAGAMEMMNRAKGVLDGVAAAGRSVATDLASAASRLGQQAAAGMSAAGAPAAGAPAAGATAGAGTAGASTAPGTASSATSAADATGAAAGASGADGGNGTPGGGASGAPPEPQS